MTHFSQRDNFSTAARVLGALFYYAPDSAEASALVSALSNDGWQAQWPLEKTTLSPLVAQFQAEADESLPQAWQRLFVGPYALPSPPWGSVWLDREKRVVWRLHAGSASVDAGQRYPVCYAAK
ncbi:Putative oxidoreductase component of anaerobic dehydrogenases; Functional role page for Chaperone protein TorD [Citrobacter freundii]|uniref:Oxidoreductase component of anaerobic dehydrogenases Functional role page for Chaperone protein TorD n=1 Tax=Citrobacter freundii TaxID=546 RepID=A0A7G2IWX0_CITFR|nr:Putative oxidoreductase component of anaerobic dehydrogenases; Functional role page for Chaperone protein TorD [Citrobacter freundii]